MARIQPEGGGPKLSGPQIGGEGANLGWADAELEVLNKADVCQKSPIVDHAVFHGSPEEGEIGHR